MATSTLSELVYIIWNSDGLKTAEVKVNGAVVATLVPFGLDEKESEDGPSDTGMCSPDAIWAGFQKIKNESLMSRDFIATIEPIAKSNRAFGADLDSFFDGCRKALIGCCNLPEDARHMDTFESMVRDEFDRFMNTRIAVTFADEYFQSGSKYSTCGDDVVCNIKDLEFLLDDLIEAN